MTTIQDALKSIDNAWGDSSGPTDYLHRAQAEALVAIAEQLERIACALERIESPMDIKIGPDAQVPEPRCICLYRRSHVGDNCGIHDETDLGKLYPYLYMTHDPCAFETLECEICPVHRAEEEKHGG